MSTSPEKSAPREALRIIDANLNRAGEGLRVLEDIARLGLNDAAVSEQLKNLRHRIVALSQGLSQQLVGARDARGDVGMGIKTPEQAEQKSLSQIMTANARRVEESVRTLEELAKTSGIEPGLKPEDLEQARFELYTIEKGLLSRLLRKDKVEYIRGLCAILDTGALKGRSPGELAGELIGGGARIIQLRDKLLHRKQLLEIAAEIKEICSKNRVLFIINDYLDIALASDADGLHLGMNDLPAVTARRLLPVDKIIGLSVKTPEQAAIAYKEGVDYIGVGAIYPTSSKNDTTVITTEGLARIRRAVNLPIVAIGGINRDNAARTISCGADAVAVISAIMESESPREYARQIVDALEVAGDQTNR
mgnify:FL=1